MPSFPTISRRSMLTGGVAAGVTLAAAGNSTADTTPDIQAAVDQAHKDALAVSGGKNADYIPYLANVPKDLCAVAVVTKDGQSFTAGDAEYGFAIESISKVFTMALVMQSEGPEKVRELIGVDPTGLPFNSVLALEINNGKPLSPLVNAGAIAAASLVPGKDREEKWQNILDYQSAFAGAPIKLSDEVNHSEQTTNSHNRAIAWLLESAGTIYSDPMAALDIYTRQCSTLVSCRQLAVMGATLANDGVNPLTKKKVTEPEHVPYILAQMTMEGLYTYSGDFAYTVGLPGKSGVGGGILAVAPGKLAIAAFAPPVNAEGNSVRGLVGVASVAKSLGLNVYKPS